MGIKQRLKNNLKNIGGWKTERKIVVLSVDDYGNVRLDSKEAHEKMEQAGLEVCNRFDAYDTIETSEDLESLYEVLTSVTDKNGRHALFTPFAIPCNINFEAMAQDGYREYLYESLIETFRKLEQQQPEAYNGAWDLWQEGMEKGLMVPQFHGREHINLNVFKEKLRHRDPELLSVLKTRSCARLSNLNDDNISWTQSFAFNTVDETKSFPKIIRTGIDEFEKVFGYWPAAFTPPAQSFPKHLEPNLREYGIEHLDKPFVHQKHYGEGQYKREFNVTTRDEELGLNILVRNVVFEPTNGNIDHVGKALKQIEAAFRWNRPAIISSHRVNFCGHIDEENRRIGLNTLEELLNKIVSRWPDVEFMSADELGDLIVESNNK